jgi:hypothetical protein
MNWTAVEAIGVWTTAAIALGGAIFVWRQLQQVERTIRGDTHERLTTESFEVLKFLASNPESYPYFYEGKTSNEEGTHHHFVLYAAEMITNYLEHVVSQKDDMSAADWKAWEHVIIDTFQKSPAVIDHIKRLKDWYSVELLRLATQYL